MKNFRSTGIFAVLVVGFLSYVYFVEYKGSEKKQQQKEENSKIVQFKAEGINAITITTGAETVELKSESPDVWVVIKPIMDKADTTQVNQFLNSLSEEKSTGSIEGTEAANLSLYGLETPKSVVTLTYKDSKVLTLSLGSVGGVGGIQYLKLSDNPKILIVGTGISPIFEKKVKDFRDRNIFRTDKDQIQNISIRSGSTTLQFARVDSNWRLVGKYQSESDAAAIENFVSSIVQWTAGEFASEDKNKFQLGSKTQTLQFKTGDKTIVANVYKTKQNNQDKYFVTREDLKTVYEVAQHQVNTLSKTENDFRDKKRPFIFDQSKISQIDYKTEGMDLNLKKEGDSWTTEKPVDTAKVSDLIKKLGDLKVEKFYGKTRASMVRPKGTITLKDSAGQIVFDFKWGNEDTKDNVTVVKTHQNDEMFGVEKTLVSQLSQIFSKPETPKEENKGLPTKETFENTTDEHNHGH